MIRRMAFRFRWFIILLILSSTILGLLLTVSSVYKIRKDALSTEIVNDMSLTVGSFTRITEGLLDGIEQNLRLLLQASMMLDERSFSQLLSKSTAETSAARALYFIDGSGETFAVRKADYSNAFISDLIGIDFSNTPLYMAAKQSDAPVWSDKFISILSGDTSVGVAVRNGDRTAIAELSLTTLLDTVNVATEGRTRVIVIDGRGEVMADTGARNTSGILNISNMPSFARLISDGTLPEIIELGGDNFLTSSSVSGKLGWYFITAVPAGIRNSQIRNILIDMLLLGVSFLVAAIVILPIWSRYVTRNVSNLWLMADQIAGGEEVDYSGWQEGVIIEFNELAEYMLIISRKIKQREIALTNLNEELETRVKKRTQEIEERNSELHATLQNLNKMQNILVESEKHAALGRLVGGIAHELNTPIGNAMMAVSSLSEERLVFIDGIREGLKKAALDAYIEQSGTGLDIAARNIERVAELVESFKHVAVDQTSSIRRKFRLKEILNDVFITLNPMLKRSRHSFETRIETDIDMDSFPGVIQQIVTNLITNALTHAWDDDRQGTITVTAVSFRKESPDSSSSEDWISLRVSDDGRGIPEAIEKKIFDPFFTTRMGRGGTGLGLNIAFNGAANILGGTLSLNREVPEGAEFVLEIPACAPVLVENA